MKIEKNKPAVSVWVIAYNMAATITDTLSSVLAQTFRDFEVIVADDYSKDETQEVMKRFSDERIRYYRNEVNIGFANTLELCKERSLADIVYLLPAKSIISKDALEKTVAAFALDKDIGAVTRPYYWFGETIQTVVRTKEQYDKSRDAVLSIESGSEAIIAVFKTLDNPGGLAYRKEFFDIPFHHDPFVEVAYPFASIFKKHKIVYLKDYTMACPAFLPSGSQNQRAYEKSPIQDWVDLFTTVFPEERFRSLRKKCIKNFVAVNYIGLVQVRNYARKYSYLIREVCLLLKYRWQNIFNPQFWFFSIGTLIMPRMVLKWLVKAYKAKVNSRIIEAQNKDCVISLNL